MLIVAALSFATTTQAVGPETEAANTAVAYMRTLQNADGGFPGFGEESSPGTTLDAVFALVAAGVDPLDVTTDGNSPADYLAANADTYSADAGGAAKLMLGVVLMGLDYTDFGGTNGGLDLPSVLEGHLAEDPATGVYGLDLFDQAFYLLALTAAGEPIRPAAVDYLASLQLDDGGWEFGPEFGSDTNTSAMAVQALLAAGVSPDDAVVERAVEYLHSAQHDSGGFGFLAGLEPDAQSTAFVIQALVAASEEIGPGGPWERVATPLAALLSFQNSETGAFQFEGVDSPFATFQSVPGLMLAPFPDLESRIVEEPIATSTPRSRPTEVEATSTPAPLVLPPAGGGPSDTVTWWPVALLIVAGAGAAGAAVLARRPR